MTLLHDEALTPLLRVGSIRVKVRGTNDADERAEDISLVPLHEF